MSGKKRNDGFLIQASILAAAGILVRIIGMLYRSPMTMIIGDEGNGYYSTAYNIYVVVLLISSYSIPTAISKIVSSKLALKQYKNAHRTFLCALYYVIGIGGIASIFTFIFAPVLVADNSNAVFALRIFAPTIFFSGILGVLRGYFQAHHNMVPTSLSQIVEQIVNAVVSIAAAWFFTKPYRNPEKAELLPMYGAGGGAVGTGMGVCAGLLFLIFAYGLNRSFINRRVVADKDKNIEPYPVIFKSLLFMVTPVIFSTFIYNISTSLDMTIFYKIMSLKGMANKDASTFYGVFSGKYMVLINVPVAMASAVATAMIPNVSTSYTAGDMQKTNKKISEAIRFTMLIAIPAAIGMGVLARPIMQLLFPQPETIELASCLLCTGCISVVFYSLSTVTNGVLQGVGRVHIPVKNALIALVIHAGVLISLLFATDWGVYALLAATILYSFLMCLLNGFSVKKYLKYRQDIKKTFVIPLLSALIMAVVTRLSYEGVHLLLKSNVIGIIISVMLAVLTYFIMLIKLKGVEEKEFNNFPKGTVLLSLARRLRLL